MATKTRKRITAPVLPAWHGQFQQFIEHVSETTPSYSDSERAVLLALHCMADVGNVRDAAYDRLREAAVLYSRTLCCYRFVNRAVHAEPSSWECKSPGMLAAQRLAWGEVEAAGTTLRRAMRDVQPTALT